MKHRIAAKVFSRRVNGVAEINTDHFALLSSRYVIRDTADTNSHLHYKLVSDRFTIKIHKKPHPSVHVFRTQVPVGFRIPVIADPFLRKRPQDVLLARSRRLPRKSETRKLACDTLRMNFQEFAC